MTNKLTPEERIWKLLKKGKFLPSTEISAQAGVSYSVTLEILLSLKREGLVKAIKPHKVTYWGINKKDPIQQLEAKQ